MLIGWLGAEETPTIAILSLIALTYHLIYQWRVWYTEMKRIEELGSFREYVKEGILFLGDITSDLASSIVHDFEDILKEFF
ncbi:hypothetical protein DHX103_03755 [Planococcus sp. X10-3]|uniref:hypothetical protein n=1 Tax=Planococcus sp. X10-3 TaxID=3061240 RepID=UPI003BAF7E94